LYQLKAVSSQHFPDTGFPGALHGLCSGQINEVDTGGDNDKDRNGNQRTVSVAGGGSALDITLIKMYLFQWLHQQFGFRSDLGSPVLCNKALHAAFDLFNIIVGRNDYKGVATHNSIKLGHGVLHLFFNGSKGCQESEGHAGIRWKVFYNAGYSKLVTVVKLECLAQGGLVAEVFTGYTFGQHHRIGR
jgi:hypothetical protein